MTAEQAKPWRQGKPEVPTEVWLCVSRPGDPGKAWGDRMLGQEEAEEKADELNRKNETPGLWRAERYLIAHDPATRVEP